MAYYSRAALVLCVIISILLINNVKCNRQKRATGAVPHSLHAQMLRADTVGNNTQQIVSTLEIQTEQMISVLQMQMGQFKNLTDEVKSMSAMMATSFAKLSQSFAVLTKGLRLTAGDCSDVVAQRPYTSGIYTITPWDDLGTKGSFKVYCDMNPDDAGWTVFQRRVNGSVDFFRDWVDYKNGFGELAGEFWLGLDKLHRLTSTRVSWELKVELEDFEGNTAYAVYKDFGIGNELSQFQLSIGAYSGTAGDSLSYHGGMKFSTKDRDNDVWGSDCANSQSAGAWWYKACCYSNLNGPYLTSATSTHKAITWIQWKGTRVALKKAQMKTRPIFL